MNFWLIQTKLLNAHYNSFFYIEIWPYTRSIHVAIEIVHICSTNIESPTLDTGHQFLLLKWIMRQTGMDLKNWKKPWTTQGFLLR